MTSPTLQPDGAVWLHLKSGGRYEIVCEAENEADLTPVVVYKSQSDGRIWVRPTSQFMDGRFVRASGESFR